MASLHFSPLLIAISLTIFISTFSSVSSLTCETQKLPPNRSYTNCTNLPTFNATLHFTHNTSTNLLNIAFSIDSPKSDGWVSWGINPTGPTMFGTGAFIAIKENGKVSVDTYNLISPQIPYKKEKLPFQVIDPSVEDVNGVITIFATVGVPEKAQNLSQIWQVGPVAGGVIKVHGTEKVNDDSTAPLKLAVVAHVPAPVPAPAPAPSAEGEKKSGGVKMMMGKSGLGFYFGLVLVLLGFMSM
ncbi:hypothetical protein Lal_00011268 [Lupinus albus]|uniref:Putative DOMON domain-containing protein n=1 Tax=Lupinus albus TaxID=3870 RepID=A0A6A4PH90_LUPAL|nr:putative DOMON domain-containing protein [Lupinus albus]KAF1888495.1 hypothetical protein Lal_00011268 [Lupinus albus]